MNIWRELYLSALRFIETLLKVFLNRIYWRELYLIALRFIGTLLKVLNTRSGLHEKTLHAINMPRSLPFSTLQHGERTKKRWKWRKQRNRRKLLNFNRIKKWKSTPILTILYFLLNTRVLYFSIESSDRNHLHINLVLKGNNVLKLGNITFSNLSVRHWVNYFFNLIPYTRLSEIDWCKKNTKEYNLHLRILVYARIYTARDIWNSLKIEEENNEPSPLICTTDSY